MTTSCASLMSAEATVGDYLALLKPRVMSLVVFTGLAGMVIAPGFSGMHPFLAIVAMLALALGAGAAGAINMWYDRDIDALMKRTESRPLPMGKIEPAEALSFGVVMSLAAVMLMGVAINWTAAGLLAFANLFYVLVYTMWLKRVTPQNIVIGGAAGAFPPMIGWAAVTGDVTLMPLLLFLMIFIWTPPHFWALSLFANEDYKRAGVPMLPVVSGMRATKIQMLVYTVLLIPVTLAPAFLGLASMAYGAVAGLLGALFLLSCLRVYASDDLKQARIMFGYSVFYLFALFCALMVL